jgi:hypothetical protein
MERTVGIKPRNGVCRDRTNTAGVDILPALPSTELEQFTSVTYNGVTDSKGMADLTRQYIPTENGGFSITGDISQSPHYFGIQASFADPTSPRYDGAHYPVTKLKSTANFSVPGQHRSSSKSSALAAELSMRVRFILSR